MGAEYEAHLYAALGSGSSGYKKLQQLQPCPVRTDRPTRMESGGHSNPRIRNRAVLNRLAPRPVVM